MKARLTTLTILAALVLPLSLHAQITFERTYGGDSLDLGLSVMQTPDGGYILVGNTGSFGAGGHDVYLIKTDANGDTLWTRTFGGTYDDQGWSVQQTADNGHIIAGLTESFGAGESDVYLIKTDALGDMLWTRTFGGASGDFGSSVQQTADGGYIIAGGTSSFGADGGDVWLIKLDAVGETLWTRTYGGASVDVGYSVQQTSDSGYIIAGWTASFGAGNADVYVIKTDAAGDTMWTRTCGGTDQELSWSVQQTAGSSYLVAGSTFSFGEGPPNVYLVKIDANGATLWTRTYGGTAYDQGYAVQQAADGGYTIAGSTSSFGAGQSDIYLIKTDSVGDTLWTRTYGGPSGDDGRSVQQTADGGLIIAGFTQSFGAGSADFYLIKTDADGHVAVTEPKAGPTRTPALSLSCEPNPCRFSTVLHLTAGPLDHSTTLLRIYDSQGCLVHSVSGIRTSSFPLDLRVLPSGTYFIRCGAGEEHATARLVLQR